MKKNIFYFLTIISLLSCQKEDEDISIGTGSGSTNTPNIIQSQTFYTTPFTFDSSYAIEEFNSSYLGTYKGVLTHNKTGTGYYVIHTQRDTSMSGFIYLNNDSIDVSKIDVNSMTNSITYSINQNGVSINLTTDLIGNIYTETCSVNNINYEMYTLKEKSNDSVRIYLGTWVSEVITPINSFTETGIWNLVTNNSIINGSNGEGLLPGTKNGSQLKGEHADGNYSGSQLKSNCEGTFTWSSRGVSGTGNWNSKQAF